MKFKFYIHFFLIMTPWVSNGQSPINQLSKKDVLSFFEKDMKQQFPEFSVANFDRIELFGKSSGEYFISFSNAINYVPLHAAYYYSAAYIFEIVKNKGDYNIRIIQTITSPYSSSENPKAKDFYTRNSTDSEKVKKIITATKISEIAATDVCFIYEKSDQYEVMLINEFVEGFWTIDKNNFSVIREGHNSLIPEPGKKSEWVKIDWK